MRPLGSFATSRQNCAANTQILTQASEQVDVFKHWACLMPVQCAGCRTHSSFDATRTFAVIRQRRLHHIGSGEGRQSAPHLVDGIHVLRMQVVLICTGVTFVIPAGSSLHPGGTLSDSICNLGQCSRHAFLLLCASASTTHMCPLQLLLLQGDLTAPCQQLTA